MAASFLDFPRPWVQLPTCRCPHCGEHALVHTDTLSDDHGNDVYELECASCDEVVEKTPAAA